MHLQELKKKSPIDLLAFAEELEVENASAMRTQDMMFAILKQLADKNEEISDKEAEAVYLKFSRTALAF